MLDCLAIFWAGRDGFGNIDINAAEISSDGIVDEGLDWVNLYPSDEHNHEK